MAWRRKASGFSFTLEVALCVFPSEIKINPGRREAAKLQGWTKIECVVSGLEGLQAELAEIDENFVRSDLTPLEFGELLLRRKEIYETLHPDSVQTNQGGPFRGNQHQEVSDKMTQTTKSFAQDTAEKLGVGRRTVERQVQIAKNLTSETKDILRGANMPVTRKQALALSRLAPGPQVEAVALLAAGEIQSVEEYAPPVRAGPGSQPGPALTPDILIAEASQFAQMLHRTAQRCRPETIAQLMPPRLNILRRQMGSTQEAVEKIEKLLEMNTK